MAEAAGSSRWAWKTSGARLVTVVENGRREEGACGILRGGTLVRKARVCAGQQTSHILYRKDNALTIILAVMD